MAGNLPRRFREGSSPFDSIAQYDDETGEPWWSAREMMPFLNYSDWRNLENVIRKAKSACQNSGHQPADHFVDANKMIDIGKGAQRSAADVHMTRFGCYFVAMNGDPDKAEVAAAQRYFVVMTRAAELEIEVPAAAIAPPAPRPWSQRLMETWQPHYQYLNIHYPGCFTVVSALGSQMLCLEDQLIRHLFAPQPSDRPDVSIGLCWANDRKARGLEPATHAVPLWLPDQQREVLLCVYSNDERGTFEAWFGAKYLTEKLPVYLVNKPEFKKFGELPPSSAADNTCRNLTGHPAALRPLLRKQLNAVKGFFPVGATLPAIGGTQRTMFD